MVGWRGHFLNWLYNTALVVMAMKFGTCNFIFPKLPTIINKLRQEQNVQHFANNSLKCIFFKDNNLPWFKVHQSSNCSQRPNRFRFTLWVNKLIPVNNLYRIRFQSIKACILLLNLITDLTHWGRVTHICVSKLTIIGSNNCLPPSHYLNQCWDIVN